MRSILLLQFLKSRRRSRGADIQLQAKKLQYPLDLPYADVCHVTLVQIPQTAIIFFVMKR